MGVGVRRPRRRPRRRRRRPEQFHFEPAPRGSGSQWVSGGGAARTGGTELGRPPEALPRSPLVLVLSVTSQAGPDQPVPDGSDDSLQPSQPGTDK